MNDELKLVVCEDIFSMTTLIYLQRYEGRTKIIIGQKDNELTEFRFDSVTPISVDAVKPLLKMPTDLANIFLKSVADYNSKKGQYTENENLLKGKLEATENHLKDMRIYLDKALKIKR